MGLISKILGWTRKEDAPTEQKGDIVVKVIVRGKEVTLLMTEQQFIDAAERAVRELNCIPIEDEDCDVGEKD